MAKRATYTLAVGLLLLGSLAAAQAEGKGLKGQSAGGSSASSGSAGGSNAAPRGQGTNTEGRPVRKPGEGEGHGGGMSMEKLLELNGKASERMLREAKRIQNETKLEDLKKVCAEALVFETYASTLLHELEAREDKRAQSLASALYELLQARRQLIQGALRQWVSVERDKTEGDKGKALRAQRNAVAKSLVSAAGEFDKLIELQRKALKK